MLCLKLFRHLCYIPSIQKLWYEVKQNSEVCDKMGFKKIPDHEQMSMYYENDRLFIFLPSLLILTL